MSALIGLLLIVLLVVCPFAAADAECQRKNRNRVKAFVLVGLFTFVGLGWIPALMIWIFLKPRDPVTGKLII